MHKSIDSFKGVSPTLGKNVYVDGSARIVGDVVLGDDASIWPLVAARGDVNKIRIGARSNIQDGSVLHVTRKSEKNPNGFPLIIGEDVTVGNRILVGMGAIVMDGVVVEDDVFIGAGTLVPPNKRLESGFLYVGNPMQKKRPLNDAEMAFLKQSAVNYVVLKDEYLEEAN